MLEVPRMSRPMLVTLASILLACGASPEQRLEEAREALARGAYTEAAAAAAEGLSGGAEAATAWRLELAGLEAEARGGRTADAVARLERLAGAWSQQVTGSLYVQTAGQLKEAGEAAGAVSVLDAGAQRFPQDAAIAAAIAQAKVSGTAAELEQLRSLGYVE
jgi:hypothetical protein